MGRIFLQILQCHTRAKILNLSKKSHFEILIFDKIHNFKVSFLTKFTISKSHFHKIDKIRIFKVSFFTKFTFLKYHFSQN